MSKNGPKKADLEKYAFYIDKESLKTLKEYQVNVGVPVSVSIRIAIKTYIKALKSR